MIGHALVLKNYFPKKNKIIILHESFGKITIFGDEKQPTFQLCNGTLLWCDIRKDKSSYRCDFVDPYFVPFDHTVYDLYFIHDLLKICMQFMPNNVIMVDVFNLIINAYQQLDTIQACQKKIYLLKLFLFLDIFPDNKQLYQLVMQDKNMHSHDSDLLLEQGLKFCWNADLNYA